MVRVMVEMGEALLLFIPAIIVVVVPYVLYKYMMSNVCEQAKLLYTYFSFITLKGEHDLVLAGIWNLSFKEIIATGRLNLIGTNSTSVCSRFKWMMTNKMRIEQSKKKAVPPPPSLPPKVLKRVYILYMSVARDMLK